MPMFFVNNRIETEGQHNKFLLYLTYIIIRLLHTSRLMEPD